MISRGNEGMKAPGDEIRKTSRQKVLEKAPGMRETR
jgi:hypothetical protein